MAKPLRPSAPFTRSPGRVALWVFGAGACLLGARAAGAPALGAPPPAAAAHTAPAPAPDEEESDLTVTAKKLPTLPGSVIGDIQPEVMLSPSDIQSFGVSTVTELLEELEPETRSERGRSNAGPVVLLNGRRISSLAEIQNIPTEAILRVDILPEEVSLKYGYTADQRVVNIVLRRRFHATTLEAIGGGATEGGDASGKGEADLLRIRGDNRLNLDLKAQVSDGLTEAERGIFSPTFPYSSSGTLLAAVPGMQIDPAFSLLAGVPVTSAVLPVLAPLTGPTLAQLLAGANSTPPGDDAAARSLLGTARQVTANAVYARALPYGVQGTLNATLGASRAQSLQGLEDLTVQVPAAGAYSPFSSPVAVDRLIAHPLRQTTDGWTAHLGSTLNKDQGPFRLSLTDAIDHADTTVSTDTGFSAAAFQAAVLAGDPAADPFTSLPDLPVLPEARARTITDQANVQLLANGPVLRVPAGEVYVSGKVGDAWSSISSNSLRLGVFRSSTLARNDLNAQLSVDLPLAGGARRLLAPLGDVSVNVNIAVDDLSDFGALTTLGAGLNWTPIPGVNLIVSTTRDHLAPTPAQLAGPLVATPGVRLFDFTGGQTVDVLQLTGGSAGLLADTRQVFKVGLTWKPIRGQDLTVTANYITSDIRNAVSGLPGATAALEEALPSRFVRNAQGVLIEEDDRPINIYDQAKQEIRWGLVYARPLGPQPPPRPDRRAFARRRSDGLAAQGAPPPDGATAPDEVGTGGDGRPRPSRGEGVDVPALGRGGGGGGGRGRFGGGGAPAGGRLQAAVYHTLFFRDQARLTRTGPLLDYLGGAPLAGAGGQPVNEIEAQLGATLAGFGARLSADWKSGTVVRGGADGDLAFSDLGVLNLRLFENFGQQPWATRRFAWLRGARLTFAAINLLDTRQRVRAAVGPTPLAYAGPYLDPAGRTLSVSVRKLFY